MFSVHISPQTQTRAVLFCCESHSWSFRQQWQELPYWGSWNASWKEDRKIIQVLLELSGEEQRDTPIVGLLELTLGEREAPIVGLLELSHGERGRRNPAENCLVLRVHPSTISFSGHQKDEDFIWVNSLSHQVTLFNSTLLNVVCIQT